MDDRLWVHLQKIVSTWVLKMDNRIQARLHKNNRMLVGRLSIVTKDGRSYTICYIVLNDTNIVCYCIVDGHLKVCSTMMNIHINYVNYTVYVYRFLGLRDMLFCEV